ncbi:MAG TPA: toll/interleukin-1 receptor domain-containing protein, partial [Candidatus Hydrogenedentes bacterium]|nr:toll/interleukin-1 receptor domain-containing protein [Candidatus Hydrogenedentota bacterium]
MSASDPTENRTPVNLQGPAPQYVYSAFISYRHLEKDRGWAKWLLNALETYRVPKVLRARGFPAVLGKVFRDEDEMPASGDLNDQIMQALAASKFLIVICSPGTPKSRWICREIEVFREMGRGDNILALLIEGEPSESFPIPLTEERLLHTLPDGTTHEERVKVEPLAADVRPRRDESMSELRHMALLRFAACLLGCKFDDLRQRDRERRTRRQRLVWGVITILITLALACGGWAWDQSRVKTAYFRGIVSRNGVAEGIGPVDQNAHSASAVRYRFQTRGGRVIRVFRETATGRPNPDEEGVYERV